MKRIIAILLAAMLLVMLAVPASATWQEEANAGNIAYMINAFYQRPALDATHNELSWSLIPAVPGDFSYAWSDAVPDSEAIAKAHDVEFWMTYDANSVYILIRTDARNFHNPESGAFGDIWQLSAIQVNLANYNDFGYDRLEFGIGRNSEDGSLNYYVWAQHPDRQADFTPVPGENFIVELRGGNLWYQVIVPVNTFLNRATVSEGDVIGLCLVFAQASELDPGHIHKQFASGCTGDTGKDAGRFARITLGPAIQPPAEEAPAEAPEEAAPVAPAPIGQAPAPQTNDSMIIFVSAGILALAGAAFIKRRISAK